MPLIFEADETDPYPDEYVEFLDRVAITILAVMFFTGAITSIIWTPAAVSIGRWVSFTLLFLYVSVLLAGFLRYSFDINAYRQ